ncbi:hypothetical protein [Caudoviricetes sp.]|nr:hypothetical protein [Caudoviricetes sp.]
MGNPKTVEILRPFKTDYAGTWSGFCNTRETAIIAAIKHVAQDGYTKAVITDRRSGEVVANVRLSEDRKRASVDVVKPFKKIGL